MTEIEKIQYAKSFIDNLANGIDPTSGKMVPETEIINNIRISRCLFYVSEILRQVIDNGGTTAKKKLKNSEKKPFFTTNEQLEKYPYSEYAISVSEIAKNINSLIDTETMRSISYKDITNWLIYKGILQEIRGDDGILRKRPTDIAKDLGITLCERNNGFRVYHIVLYNLSAQQLIIDNLFSILEFNNISNSSTVNKDNIQ